MTARKKAAKAAEPAVPIYRCFRGPDGEDAALVNQREKATGRTQPRCGEDLDALINAVPFDGNVHTLACPKCKGEFTLRRTPLEPAKASAKRKPVRSRAQRRGR